jgi:small multidrug resistance family-3 protein
MPQRLCARLSGALRFGPGCATASQSGWPCLARVDVAYAGRAYAAYGGIYIAASLVWLGLIEGQKPTVTDIAGAMVCLAGAVIILWGPGSQSA